MSPYGAQGLAFLTGESIIACAFHEELARPLLRFKLSAARPVSESIRP